MGDVQCCHIVLCSEIFLTKPTGVLEHCRERETDCWFSICGDVFSWPHPYGDEGCQCKFFYSQ